MLDMKETGERMIHQLRAGVTGMVDASGDPILAGNVWAFPFMINGDTYMVSLYRPVMYSGPPSPANRICPATGLECSSPLTCEFDMAGKCYIEKHGRGDEVTTACVNHPDRKSITNLDNEELCLECANAWAMGERQNAFDSEADDD